jgi:hypothetical protein
MTPVQLVVEAVTLAALLATIVSVWQNWAELPDRDPQKSNISGEVVRYGSRQGMWLIPVLALSSYIVLAVLQWRPHLYNCPVEMTAEKTPKVCATGVSLMVWMKLQMVLLFGFLGWKQVDVALAGRSRWRHGSSRR